MDNLPTVPESAVAPGLLVGVRQILLTLGGSAVTAGVLTNDELIGIVGAVITVVTIVIGQLKNKADVKDKQVLKAAVVEAGPLGTRFPGNSV